MMRRLGRAVVIVLPFGWWFIAATEAIEGHWWPRFAGAVAISVAVTLWARWSLRQLQEPATLSEGT